MAPHHGNFHTVDDYISLEGDASPWIVKPLLPSGGFLSLYGPPKSFKTYGALHLGSAIASGEKEWLGFAIVQNGPVLYLQLDTPRSLFQERLLTLQSQGVDFSHLVIADKEDGPFPFDILRPEGGLVWLREQCEALRPLVVIIDTLRELHEGDEDKSLQMKQVLNTLQEVVKPAAMIVLSHSKKDNPLYGDSVVNDNRGSSAVAGKMDCIIKVTKKFLLIEGRATEDLKIPLRKDHRLFWLRGVADSEAIKDVLSDASLTGISERARALASKTGKTFDAAKGLIQRHHSSSSPSPKGQESDPRSEKSTFQ